jgi:hypothetical protein
MKYLFLVVIIFSLLFSTMVFSQESTTTIGGGGSESFGNKAITATVPNKISYQGMLTTSAGVPLSDGSYNLKFELFNAVSAGSSLWNETQTGIPVSRGTFNVLLGSVNSLTGIFNQPLWLEVTVVSGPGVSSPLVLSPRNEFASAPYSLGPWLSNGDTLYVTNKSIGIGTASPKSVLHSISATSATHARFGSAKPVSVIANMPQIGFNISYDGGFKYADNYSGGTIAFGQYLSGGFSFNTAPSGTSETLAPLSTRMVITNAGNVGIGTLSPISPLHITSRSNADTAQLLLTETSTGFARLMLQNNAFPTRNWTIGGQLNSSDNYSLLNFRYYNGAIGSDILSITGQGRVGIGMDAPPYMLSLNNGSSATDIGLYNSTTGSTSSDGLRIGINTGTPNAWVWNYENGSLIFGTKGIERLHITGDGNVGIGTTTPTALLEVNGDVKVNGNITYSAAKTGYISGSALATGRSLSSTGSFNYASHGIYNNGASTGDYMIPFDLPNGATITEVVVYGYDGDATYQFYVYVYRQQLNSMAFSSAGSASSGAAYSAGAINVTVPVSIYNVVDNSLYAYFIDISMPVSTTIAVSGYRVTYTYTTPGAITTPVANSNGVIEGSPTIGGPGSH